MLECTFRYVSTTHLSGEKSSGRHGEMYLSLDAVDSMMQCAGCTRRLSCPNVRPVGLMFNLGAKWSHGLIIVSSQGIDWLHSTEG